MDTIYKQAYKKLLEAKKVLVFGHPRCGDSLGSTLAMTLWLEAQGKEVFAFTADEIPKTFMFLPKVHKIKSKINTIHLSEFDTILILDTDFPHSGIGDKLNKEINKEASVVINIDHHISNDGDGDINVIDKKSSSTAHMLYDFFTINNIPITKDIATCLITGIFYDTGIFSNAATDESSLMTASKLLSQGVTLNQVMNDLVKNKTFQLLRIWGKVLERLEYHKKYEIVFTSILNRDLETQSGTAKTGDLANFLNNLSEGKFSMIINEGEHGLIKVSLRTTRNDVDLARFAEFFGGGGHKKAAGFAIPGSLVYNEHEGKVKII